MAEAGQCLPVHGEDLAPLTQLAVIRGLSLSQHRLDKNPDVALCRVPTIEKLRDFLPGPFSKLTVKNVWLAVAPLCFLGSVQ